jgi:cystine transport system substrate-binding protein
MTVPTATPPEESPTRSKWWIIGGVVVVLLVLALAWTSCGRQQQAPPPEPTTEPIPSDAVCDRIDASGKIVVGTSGDYPPFSFYNEQQQLDGFDVALMRAISQELGVTPEIHDYAFDSLGSALVLGEIDVAIAAITRTQERQAVVDFSEGYFSGRGVAVGRPDAGPQSITIPGDFAGARVGVGRGTSFQSWAEANLVAPGIILSQQLFAYDRTDQALTDLREGRLEVVLLDEAAAQSAVASGDLKIVGEGAVEQVFVIAVPQGAACVQARMNQALTALRQAGVIDTLAERYIGVLSGEIPPSEPAEPEATPAPEACLLSSQLVQHLTFDDQNGTAPPTVRPNQRFSKGWRIRNTGTCTWDSQTRLAFVRGNVRAAQMDGQPVNVTGSVAPGQTFDFFVDLQAPSGVTGIMQGFWQMQDPEREFFGQTVSVMVNVVPPTAGPTATPPPGPTATPPPGPTATPPPAPTSTPPPAPNPLEGLAFEFYAIRGEPTLNDAQPRLSFRSGGELEAFDGCNRHTGTFAVEPAGTSQGGITIELRTSTSMACDGAITDQAGAFLEALDETTAYYFPPRGVLLALLDEDGEEILNGESD